MEHEREIRLKAVLTEFQSLKQELLQKFQHHIQFFYITSFVFIGIIAYILTSAKFYFLWFIPLLISPFIFRYSWEQKVIHIISIYLERIEKEKLPELIGYHKDTESSEKFWVGWQHYFGEHPIAPRFKIASLLLYILIPFGFPIGYNLLCILSMFLPINIKCTFHIAIYIVITLTYVPFIIIFTRMLNE